MKMFQRIVVLLSLLLAAACASDDRSAAFDLIDEPDAPVDSDEPETDTPDDPVDRTECVLIPSVNGDVFMGTDSALAVGAYVYATDSGSPMEDVRVEFEINEEESTTSGLLSVGRVESNDEGLAQVQLNSESDPGFIVVDVSADCGETIQLEVDVASLPTGDLRVRFNYPERSVYDVSPVRAEVILGDTAGCAQLGVGTDPSGELRAGETDSVSSSINFSSLPTGTPYTVVGIGYGDYGERAAWGCVDGVTTIEDVTTEITIDLRLLPLDPVGRYDVIANWDFRDALRSSGTAGQIISRIADVFEDPGRGLYDVINDVLEQIFGGFISGAIGSVLELFGLDDVLAGLINDVVESSPVLSDIVTVGRDITSVVSNLEVLQIWEIGRNGTNIEVFGRESVTGIALYWRLGCDENDPVDCGRLPLQFDPGDLGSLSGDWDGFVVNYNELSILPHPIDFNYGELILFAIENIILPQLTGQQAPVTLVQVVQGIIGCPGLGDAIAGGNNNCLFSDSFVGDLVGCICDTSATCNRDCDGRCFNVEDTCNDFIEVTFGPIINGLLGSLQVESVIVANGDATLVNLDDDLQVERLEDGEWRGTLNFGSDTSIVDGTFVGDRIGD